ncbi:MAG TPA: hypothetical protein VE964_04915 [Myxococcales bacterium]|nr:hypothetical protein [Myxococcales bacterium]
MKLEEKSFVPSLLVALAALALMAAAASVRESQARTLGAPSAVRLAPGPAEAGSAAAPEDSSEIIGQIEPLLVGSPAPRRDPPRRSARR